ncbi:MAG TPA: glycosyltransferase [Thermoanaerobaculia bacterium]|nr:glycosyltransferase [Thermoanaerobaculia bacterium]
MPPEATLIVVNWHTAELAAGAVASARSSWSGRLHVVVVDNSDDPAERAALDRLEPDVLVNAPQNPGYGGGANLGARHARGEVLIVANADVEVAPAALDRLARELEAPAVAMAGPRFVWDSAGRWLLPPPDVPGRIAEIDRLLAGRSRRWGEWWRARRHRRRVRFWETEEPADAGALSGALLCIRREAFESVGGFDPGFRLYFEEIDLMTRLRRRGWRLRHVPAAVCRHLYDQSAGKSAEAAGKYEESEMRYLSRWTGPRFARWAIGRRRAVAVPAGCERLAMSAEIELPAGEWVAEASPLADFGTAAGAFVEGGSLSIPREIASGLRSDRIYLRVAGRRRGEVIRCMEMTRKPEIE